ncbi:MAG: hypothetical protein QM784_20325 [Polyangiaceae bacterium]
MQLMDLTDRKLRGPIALPRKANWELLWDEDERLLLRDPAVPSERVIVNTKLGTVMLTQLPLDGLLVNSERPGWGIARTEHWVGLVRLSDGEVVARVERDQTIAPLHSKIAFDPDGERLALCSNENQILMLGSTVPNYRSFELPTGSCSETYRMAFVGDGNLLLTQGKDKHQILSLKGIWRKVDSKDNESARIIGRRAVAEKRDYIEVHRSESCCSSFRIPKSEPLDWGDFPRFALDGQMLVVKSGTSTKSKFLIYRLQGEAWLQAGELPGKSGSIDGTGRFLLVYREDGSAAKLDLSTMTESAFADPKRIAFPSESYVLADDGKQLFGAKGKCDLETGTCQSWEAGMQILRKGFTPNARYWRSTQQMVVEDDGRLLILDVRKNMLQGALLAVGGRGWAFGIPTGKTRYADVIEPIGWEPTALDWFTCLSGERVIPNQVCWEFFRRPGALQEVLEGRR